VTSALGARPVIPAPERRLPPSLDPVGPARRLAPAILPATVVIALAVPRLGRRPVWLDEAFTIGATHDLPATWRGSGGTMALYYLLMWPVTHVSLDRAWVRLPSVVFAAAAVVVVYEIGRRIGGRRMGAVAAGTLSLTWAVSRFAIEARSYTLALLLVSLSWLGLVGTVQADGAPGGSADAAGRERWWRLFAVATLLAPLAHGMAALHFVGQVAALAVAPSPHRRRLLRACTPIAAALAVEGVVLFAVGAGEVAAWIEPLNRAQAGRILRMLAGRGPALWVVCALAVASAAFAVRRFRERRDDQSWLQLTPVFWTAGAPLLILAMSLVRPYAESRYVIGSVPGVALLVGGLLTRIRRPALVLVAWLVVAATLLPSQPSVTTVKTEDWPGLADRVATEAADGDRLATPDMLRSPFDYAWTEEDGRPELVPLTPTDRIGHILRFYDGAPGGLRAQLLADPTTTVWYVDRGAKRLGEVAALVSDPEVARDYDVTGWWVFSGPLYLVRFEPRDGR